MKAKRTLTGLAGLLTLSLLISACDSSASPTTVPGEGSTTTTADVTTTEQTTTTTSAPDSTTTTQASTTTSSSVLEEAEGSGCTPGEGELPDGEWFGYALTAEADELEFDLACWFTGDAAARAAAEDGEESPPPNDYYVRNANATTRAVSIAADAEVVWYPNFGDPSSEATADYADWVIGIEDRDFMPGIWIVIDNGEVVTISEQWVP